MLIKMTIQRKQTGSPDHLHRELVFPPSRARALFTDILEGELLVLAFSTDQHSLWMTTFCLARAHYKW